MRFESIAMAAAREELSVEVCLDIEITKLENLIFNLQYQVAELKEQRAKVGGTP